MPVNISLKPGPTPPRPICLAPCSTCLVARSTFVLSAAAAAPQDRAMTTRQAGGTHNQRDLQVMTHLPQRGWLTPSPYHPAHVFRPLAPIEPGNRPRYAGAIGHG